MTDDGDLVVQRPEGPYCPPGDFHIDPWRPQREVLAEVNAWWQANADAGRASLLLACSFGTEYGSDAGDDAAASAAAPAPANAA